MSLRVLVVDDDAVIRHLIQVNLELEGFEVITAEDGEQCLSRAHEDRPDVITLDVMMPGLDGWDTAARLRADSQTADIPIVLLTARAGVADRDRGDKVGVDAYLTKPFDPADLLDAVRRVADRGHPSS